MVKKYLAIILILLFIPLYVHAEKTILERKPELIKYDYKYNLTVLQQYLYPTIYKKITTIKLNPYTKEKGNEILEKIYDVVNDYHDNNKLRFVDNPKVALYAEEVDGKSTCYLTIQLYLLEADPKAKVTGMFMVTKIFYVDKITLEPKKENTIPEKKIGSAI